MYSRSRPSSGESSLASSLQAPRSAHIRPGLSFAQAASPPKESVPPRETITEGDRQQDWITVTRRRNNSSPKSAGPGPE